MRALAILLALSTTACAARVGAPLPRRQTQVEWSTLSGPLFGPGGPSPDDVFQGDLGDCALLAQLAGLAVHRPALLTQLVKENADGTLEVTLHPDGRPRVIRVDRLFPTRGGRLLYAGEAPRAYWVPNTRGPAAQNQRPIWPMVIEKAVAQQHGGYAGIDHEVLRITSGLAGWRSVWLRVSKRSKVTNLAVIREAVQRGFVVVLGNAPKETAEARGLRPRHAYAVIAVVERPGEVPLLVLRNPTGEVRSPRVPAGPPGTFEIPAEDALSGFASLGLAGDALTVLESMRVLPLDEAPPAEN